MSWRIVRCRMSDPAWEHIRRVRMEVFVDEQDVPVELELDEFDETATHLAAWHNGVVVGVARLLEKPGHLKVGRVAVLKSFRVRGVGKCLMAEAFAFALEKGLREIVLDSQTAVTEFYRKLGFIEEGDIFLDAGIQHVRMRRFVKA